MFMNTTSSLTETTVPMEIYLLHHVASIAIVILGTPCNILPLVAIIRSKLYKQEVNIFILNLAVNNALTCCVCVPYISVMSFITEEDSVPINMTLCKIMGYITYSIVGAEILGLSLISLSRFILIVYHDKYNNIFKNRFNLKIMLAVSWLLCAFLMMLPATNTWGSLQYDHQRFFCHPFYSGDDFGKFIIIFCLLTTIPTLILCYFGIFRKVLLTRKKIQIVTNNYNGVINLRKNEGQLLISVIIVVTSFCTLYFPFFVISYLDPNMEEYSPIIHVTAMYLALAHCIIDPIIYIFTNSQIKEACMKCMKC